MLHAHFLSPTLFQLIKSQGNALILVSLEQITSKFSQLIHTTWIIELVKLRRQGKKKKQKTFPVIRHSWHLNCLSFTEDIKPWYQRWHLKLSSSLETCLGLGLPAPEGFLSTLKGSASSPPTSALHRSCFCLPRDTFWHQSDHLVIPLLHRLEAWKRFSSLNSPWLLEVIKTVSSSSSDKEEQILWNPAAFRS